jgi:hypothetical protein
MKAWGNSHSASELTLALQAQAEVGSRELFLSWPDICKGSSCQHSGTLEKHGRDGHLS